MAAIPESRVLRLAATMEQSVSCCSEPVMVLANGYFLGTMYRLVASAYKTSWSGSSFFPGVAQLSIFVVIKTLRRSNFCREHSRRTLVFSRTGALKLTLRLAV